MADAFSNGALEITKRRHGGNLIVQFSGKSLVNDPAEFVLPVLADALAEAEASDLRLVLDFKDVSYMSSAAYAPVVRILHRAKNGTAKVTVVYTALLRWQEVAFSALSIFEADGGRIEVRGE